MRKKILAATWKMNLTHSEAESYVAVLLAEIGEVNDVEIVIIPPFTAIPALALAPAKMQFIRLGAQNMHWEKSGAFTGEISAGMLQALYVKYVIVGHSERRLLFGETDEVGESEAAMRSGGWAAADFLRGREPSGERRRERRGGSGTPASQRAGRGSTQRSYRDRDRLRTRMGNWDRAHCDCDSGAGDAGLYSIGLCVSFKQSDSGARPDPIWRERKRRQCSRDNAPKGR
jgi:hypothetical protein